MEMVQLFNEIKRRLKIDDIEITLLDNGDSPEPTFVIFINTGCDMTRIFHSDLEDHSSIEIIVDICRQNI